MIFLERGNRFANRFGDKEYAEVDSWTAGKKERGKSCVFPRVKNYFVLLVASFFNHALSHDSGKGRKHSPPSLFLSSLDY